MIRPTNILPHRLARPLAAGVLAILFLSGCGMTVSNRPNDNRLSVIAGIPPLAYLIEQIGGEYVNVDVLVQPGQDPHTFEPTPRQILALAKAKLFFKIDMPFEAVLLEKISEGNRGMTVVDTTVGIKKRMADDHVCGHSAEGDHDHPAGGGTPDPHVWLSPPLLKILAKNISATLCQADPEHRRDYENNLAALLDRIDALDARVRRMLAPYRGRSFFVFHPGFGYFADAYGLKEEAVETGGREPEPQQLSALIERARADSMKTIFVQPQTASNSAQVIAKAIGGKVVPINGLAKDVIRDIEDIAKKVETALR